MAQKVHTLIVDEVKSSGYFSLSVDSTPDRSHIDQLSDVLRYLKDGHPVERFLTFLEMKSIPMRKWQIRCCSTYVMFVS